MNTIDNSRPSNGGETVSSNAFFPNKDALYEEASAAAPAAGRQHLSVAFAIDYILEHARAQMTRASRRRFDRTVRETLAAAMVAALPPEVQRAYRIERAIMEQGLAGKEPKR